MNTSDMLNYPLIQSLKYHLKWKKVYNETFADIPDRKVLHKIILPSFAAKSSVKSVLDIGCEWYNLHHHRLFTKQDYTTIDVEKDRKSFGAKQHVTGSAFELNRHFKRAKFDLVIVNGLIGNSITKGEELIELAQQAAYVTKPGGYLLIGWNQSGNGCPEISPKSAFEEAGFITSELPDLSSSQYLACSATQHWFELYQNPIRSVAIHRPAPQPVAFHPYPSGLSA